MATFLDVSLLSFLLPVFIFIFVFCIIYAILNKTKIFGDNMGALNLLASVCIAAVSIFIGSITKAVVEIIPWFAFVAIVLILIFMIFMFFGTSEKEIWETIGGQTFVFIVLIVIVFIGLTKTFEKDVSPFEQTNQTTVSSSGVQKGNVQGEVIRTLTHPRLLAAIFILVVSGFAIKLIIEKAK